MQRTAKVDYSIKDLKGRLAYVISNNNLDKRNLDKEKIATYIFRSSDVDSERKIDYSFFRDNSEYIRHSAHLKVKAYDDNEFSQFTQSLVGEEKKRVEEQLKPKGKDVFEKMATSSHERDMMVVIDDSFSLEDRYIDALFVDKMGLAEKKQCIKHRYKIGEIESERLIEQIIYLLELAFESCESEEEIATIALLSMDKSEAEIASVLTISRTKVNNMINKVLGRF